MRQILFLIPFMFSGPYATAVELDTVEVERLEQVIVSATRSTRQLSSLPMPAQIVSEKEIKQINSLRLHDLLKEQTGLITVPDFRGEGIQIQGMDSQYSLILIDGVPLVGRSAGTLDLSRIAIGNVKQIEIVKGASSSLYGNEALGGVINIITHNPSKGINSRLDYRIESYNMQDMGIRVGVGLDRIRSELFLNRNHSDGYDFNKATRSQTVEPFTSYTLNNKWELSLNDHHKLTISARYYNQIQEHKTQTATGETEANDWNGLLKLNSKFSETWQLETELYATQYLANEYLNTDSTSTREYSSNFDLLLLKPEIRLHYTPWNQHHLILGGGITRQSLDRTYFATKPVFEAPFALIHYDFTPIEDLNLIIGARYDAHNQYESQLSPKIAVGYALLENLRLKSSVGYGYKAPEFRQLYFDFTNSAVGYTVLGYNAVANKLPQMIAAGEVSNVLYDIHTELNTKLKAESAININIGLNFRPVSGWNINLNIFKNNIDNLIDTRVIARKKNGQNVFSYYNINKVYTQGIELDSRWAISPYLTIAGGYQWLEAKDKTIEEKFDNGEVYYRPAPLEPSVRLKTSDYFGLYNRSKHMANLKLYLTYPAWGTSINMRTVYRSQYGIADSNGNNYLDIHDQFVKGYTLWNTALNQQIGDNITLALGINNLTNYTDKANISNLPGRQWYSRISWQL